MTGLHGRSFLKELDLAPAEWTGLLDLAAELKAAKRAGTETQRLRGKNIALVFAKTSTRTRAAFEVAAYDQGAHVTFLDPTASQLGHKESVKDTARVLGRMYDAIEFRGEAQADVETLAAHAGVPVLNGLTDDWHPTQMLADHLTMREHAPVVDGRRKADAELVLAYVGDGRNNTARSVLVAGALLGLDVRVVAPVPLQPAADVVAAARQVAARTGARLAVTDDVAAGVAGADFVYTDVWVSMGEPPAVWAERIALLRDYQVNAGLMAATGNPAAKLLHCLPAYHDLGTAVGREVHAQTGMDALEVTDEVFEAHAEVIFDQAENRMHTIKAVLVATLA
ncbi:ornithine carbamoyltransferase [Georgenia sp. TF02-10]|uniref:ornithine carbamoyltransferase n=1 Tax=Georgenia sp. TF02-10 TaxID=2917725 RepID=UPI001FA701E0|nr:ornithine carbamoyltransferase [Georgenia sp. TF02-10]UNX56028.1 ornithine carbamoyltransferase [Georgenia sp. TF02-10]